MCGICGKLMLDDGAAVEPSLVQMMTDTLRHRGPDDDGYYCSGPVGLGFRRLAIIDLATGHQPLSNEDGTIWIVFNGEIYNYEELRRQLLSKGHVFRTKTDTEVIVHLYEELGAACVERLRGMFAFAIWDDRRKVLFMARDRVGIKPLYYCLTKKSFLFASEIKAILADPEVRPEILSSMIDRFLTLGYLAGKETLFRNIHKLMPGFYMEVREGKVETREYWDLEFRGSNVSLHEAQAQLLPLLNDAVQLHMISDVAVGFLLSGGLDSTALLSLAVGKTNRPLSSFTVGFSEAGVIDERPYARLAARTFGTDHHEITITPQNFESFMPKYVWHMEEPVFEPPAVALFYVSRLAKDFVKVLISGEGGDEAFAGYSNYRNLLWLERFKSLLGPFNGALSRSLSLLNRLVGSKRLAKYSPLLRMPFESYYYSGTSIPVGFSSDSSDDLYTREFARCLDKEYSVVTVKKYLGKGPQGDLVNRMLYVDTKTWLADDLLLKADKMTMANSIELRVPFLDHEVLQFAASLPGKFKVRGLTTKYVAKRTLRNQVPSEILKRKKAGFPVPYDAWLRTSLKSWVNDILFDRRTVERGYFEKNTVESLISGNVASGRYSKKIFSLVVLELWHRMFLK